MSEIKAQYEKYVQDHRIPCKYGVKCYQKNPIHHEKYKHPPLKKNEDKNPNRHATKKFKAENKVIRNTESDSDNKDNDEVSDSSSTSQKNKTNVNNDVSDSDQGSSSKEGQDNSDNESDDCGDEKSANASSSSEMATEEETKKSKCKNDSEDTCADQEKETTKEMITHHATEEELQWSKFINEKFLVSMPKDFYQFWIFCSKLKPNNGLLALRDVGLTLVGPFDVLAGRFKNVSKSDDEYLIHWRYFRDPPELQTVLKGDDRIGYHIGYFRDTPEEMPVFLVSNSAKKDGTLTPMGSNIFAAVNFYLDDLKKTGDPFKKMHIGRIQAALKKEVEKLKIDLSKKNKNIIEREKKIVARTLNKIGLVVPYNKKTELGYRELALNNKDLNTLFTKLENSKSDVEKQKLLSDLQPVFTFSSIATDECDFGTGIELGWNIISHGVEDLNRTAERSLAINYRLLKREAFARIAEAHMKNRRKGCDLSIL
ncbi:histone PARylation factor 1 isoform X1 [Leptinotarsa decemlineata]|uniref:histone PARylation factor 1 isoform X1 n=1 Tax=Leptinotarsa decemlineata TaxID=7539 RepID=UPI003D3085C8